MANLVQISESLVLACLGSNEFYTKLPEFKPLQAKLKIMRMPLDTKKGCSGCNAKRIRVNILPAFVAVVNALSPDSLMRFKTHVGADKLMFSINGIIIK
jgi:hypothetical protein